MGSRVALQSKLMKLPDKHAQFGLETRNIHATLTTLLHEVFAFYVEQTTVIQILQIHLVTDLHELTFFSHLNPSCGIGGSNSSIPGIKSCDNAFMLMIVSGDTLRKSMVLGPTVNNTVEDETTVSPS
jgi:hypothetical protein